MGLEVGSPQADSGMARAIYEALERTNQDTLNGAIKELPQKVKEVIQQTAKENWQNLAYAIAEGVVTYIKDNMEMSDIQTTGQVTMTIQGITESADVVFTRSKG